MNLEQGVALSIRVKIADHCQLIFSRTEKPLEVESELSLAQPKSELEVESELSLAQLKSERDALRRDLDEFQRSVVGLKQPSLRNVGEALHRLHLRGRQILYRLFDDDEKLEEAAAMCRDACPNWEQPGWNPPSQSLAPHVIEVRTAVDHGIPFDLLPLLNPLDPPAVENLADLARTAGTLLGFSAVVRRTFVDSLPGERRLRIENMDSFPLKMFWDGELGGAKNAAKFFAENSAYFDPKGGPWPTGTISGDESRFCEEVADYLWDPESSFDGARHQADQLCYFFCHCDTSAPNPEEYRLYLGTGGFRGHLRGVPLKSLTDGLRQRNLKKDRKPRSRPLVFLNACGSATLDPAAATSFPRLFLSKNLGFLGFLGTEATVSDVFASTFAEVFYRHFVGGLPLGRALHAARWYMLRKYQNPLGILYTLYADPEIEVRRKVESLRQNLLD